MLVVATRRCPFVWACHVCTPCHQIRMARFDTKVCTGGTTEFLLDEGDGAGENDLTGGMTLCTLPAELRDFAVITDVDGRLSTA